MKLFEASAKAARRAHSANETAGRATRLVSSKKTRVPPPGAGPSGIAYLGGEEREGLSFIRGPRAASRT